MTEKSRAEAVARAVAAHAELRKFEAIEQAHREAWAYARRRHLQALSRYADALAALESLELPAANRDLEIASIGIDDLREQQNDRF